MIDNLVNKNVLSQRYATEEINRIFSEYGKNLAERELWIAVLKAQKELGMAVPSGVIEKFERAKHDIDLKRIHDIERVTRHDIKAKIQAFVEVAGAGEHIHKGMTSRDLTDNVEQYQFLKAGKIIFGKYISVLRRLVDRAKEYEEVFLTARTHHQPAQLTLLGRRFSMWAEELLIHLEDFEYTIEHYPLRGIKGPVGTQQDMKTLLGSADAVYRLESIVAKHLGFNHVLSSTGQVYPRSLDLKLLSSLSLLASGPQNFATGMRLMAGYELMTEGFKKGQVGSSAMPHKMNTRTSERIWGLAELLKMYADGASRLSGSSWEEGDVSCSVVRRVMMPDSFYASDGLCEATLTVLDELGHYPVMLEREVNRYLPFLATTKFLMKAVEKGMGREEAHEIIRRHAVAQAKEMRYHGSSNHLVEKLGKDEEFPLSESDMQKILSDVSAFVGNSYEQIKTVSARAYELISRHPESAFYGPADIL